MNSHTFDFLFLEFAVLVKVITHAKLTGEFISFWRHVWVVISCRVVIASLVVIFRIVILLVHIWRLIERLAMIILRSIPSAALALVVVVWIIWVFVVLGVRASRSEVRIEVRIHVWIVHSISLALALILTGMKKFTSSLS